MKKKIKHINYQNAFTKNVKKYLQKGSKKKFKGYNLKLVDFKDNQWHQFMQSKNTNCFFTIKYTIYLLPKYLFVKK